MVQFTLFGLTVSVDFTVPAVAALYLLLLPPGALRIALAAAVIHETAHFWMLASFGCWPSALQVTALGLRLQLGQTVCCSLTRLSGILLSGAVANGLAALLLWNHGCVDAALVNAGMGLFNLLPYRATDGGTLLYTCLEEWLLPRYAEWLRPLWRLLVLLETGLLVLGCVRWGIRDVSVWAMLVFLTGAEALEECGETHRKTVAKKRKIC